MNKLRLFTFLFAALLIGSLTSCGKDDDTQPTPQALLTAKVWQGNKIYIDDVDYSSFLDMDNTTWKFNSNGTYTLEIDGDSETGTWELTTNNSKLLLDDEFEMEILKLTNTSLNVEWTEEDEESGETYTVEMRFIRD